MAFKQERRWGVVFLFPSAFVIGKFACDLLFVGQGRTPFDIESHWFLEFEEPMLEWAQSLAFILSSPLTSGFGLEDYINYVFQRPGAELLSDGSPGLVMMYGTLAILSAVLVAHFFLFNEKVKSEYKEYLFFIGGVSLGFVAFSWLASKPISVAEESRHIRVAGLLFLPVVLTYLNQFLKKLTWLVPICLLIYGLNSHWSKMTRDKVILPEMKFALSEIADEDAWDMFSELVDSSDFYYVINADWMFPHDQCRGFFNHDDFRSVEVIANRPDVKLDGESIVFLFPARFGKTENKMQSLGIFNPRILWLSNPSKSFRLMILTLFRLCFLKNKRGDSSSTKESSEAVKHFWRVSPALLRSANRRGNPPRWKTQSAPKTANPTTRKTHSSR